MDWQPIKTLQNPFRVVWLKDRDGRVLKGNLHENPTAIQWANPIKL